MIRISRIHNSIIKDGAKFIPEFDIRDKLQNKFDGPFEILENHTRSALIRNWITKEKFTYIGWKQQINLYFEVFRFGEIVTEYII